MERVILVDEKDREIGQAEKLEAHRVGLLHRAFSLLLYNEKGEMLIQKRADGKYHGAGLWSNACCSHPRPGELIKDAVQRRAKEELGLETENHYLFKVKYEFDMGNGLIEHEMDHVFVGRCHEDPKPDPEEISDWKYVDPTELEEMMEENPERFFSLVSVDQIQDRFFKNSIELKIFKKSYSQDLPISLEKAWDFFSNPGNLSKITPPDMGFQVKSNFNGSEIYPGQLIYYTVKPVFGIKMSWVTEITAVEKEKYFIDYQCAGPYRLWHHEHRFLATEGGVRVEDTIHYAIPLGFIGSIMNSIMVSGRIDQIFNFRKGVLDSLFGK